MVYKSWSDTPPLIKLAEDFTMTMLNDTHENTVALPNTMTPKKHAHHINESLIDFSQTHFNSQELSEQILLSTINAPEVYGKLENEDTYLKVMKLFFQSTDETLHRKQYFINYANQNRTIRDHFIDIGIGDGEITKILFPIFNKATLIDTNAKALNQDIALYSKNTSIKKINMSILDADLSEDKYDLIVLSHVLYYLPPDKIMKTLKTLFNNLNKGGQIIIVLSGGLDKEKIIRDFSGDFICLSKFTNDLYRKFGSVTIHDIEEYSSACTKKAALQIAGFYLCDGNTTATHKILSEYIEYYKLEQRYHFSFIQRFVVLSA